MRVACFLLPLIAALVPYGLPVFAGLCAVGSLFFLYRNRVPFNLRIEPTLFPILMVLVWMGASCFHAPDKAQAFSVMVKVLGMGLAGLCVGAYLKTLSPEKSQRALRALAWGVGAALIWMALDSVFEGYMRAFFKKGAPSQDLYDRLLPYNMGATSLALFIWPALWGLGRGKIVLGLVGLAAAAFVLKNLYSHSAFLGLFVGVVFFCGTFVLRKGFIYLVAGSLFLGVLGAPQLTLRLMEPEVLEEVLPKGAKPSYIHRVWIWRYVAHRALEKPLTGWGLDASRHESLKQGLLWGSKRFCIPYGGKVPYDGCLNEALPLHPHNIALQIWLELGMVGAVLFALFFVGVLASIARARVCRAVQSTFMAVFGASFFISSTAYGMWQSWWIMSMIFGALLLTLVTAQDKKDAPSQIG